MQTPARPHPLPGLLIVAAMGSLIASCASLPQADSQSGGMADQRESAAVPAPETTAAPQNSSSGAPIFVADATPSAPQLIKRAEMWVKVDAVDDAIRQSMAIARTNGGDLLNLQNTTPEEAAEHHVASLTLRVPQARLEAVLEQLSELGGVEQQAIAAEDVSGQLVDYEARLRNLRKAETMLLDIMERSGNMGEVLQVAQELQTIRQSIEQVDGQLSALKNQVNFSTISLTLEAEATAPADAPSALTRLGDTWSDATRSVGQFTLGLMQTGLWLLVYSPYLAVLGGAGWLGYRLWRRDLRNS